MKHFGMLVGDAWRSLRADWALRLPLVLVPLLALALALVLVRVLLLNQDSAARLGDVHTMLVPPAVGMDMAERASFLAVQGMADKLGRWLTAGRASAAMGPSAVEIGSLVRDYLRHAPEDAVGQFWQPLSGHIADLENAVRDGIIATPESIALVRSLREDYARLREIAETRGAEPLPDLRAVTRAGDIAAELARRLERAGRLAGWALAIGAGLLVCLALLLVGWRRHRERRQQKTRVVQRHDQDAILRLLDEMSPLADGDLSVHATVSEAKTGALADAFNHAVTELRRLVGDIHRSSDAVLRAVDDTRHASRQLAQASTVQAREILRSSNYLNAMSDTMAQLSADAADSTRIAATATREARQGGEAVRDSLQGLDRIGEMSDMTLRLMQRLVENTEAINARIVDVQSVARRTDLLALNTTIRAAGGQAGGAVELSSTGDLSRLADDVADLSEVLGAATRDIGNLTDIIREDASLTIHSMQRTREEILGGQTLARDATAALARIETISAELQQLIDDIASKSLRQAGVVRQLSTNMGVINGITRESSQRMQASAQSLESLHAMAATLREGVAGFRLPERGERRQRPQHRDASSSTRVTTP